MKDKSNKIVLSKTFSQPCALVPSDDVEAFKVTFAMPIVLTHLICLNLPNWMVMHEKPYHV